VKSFERIASDNDLVIIEGTGHAGVGSVFDLSNSVVARLLGANVILISSGGIGKPIDEVMLNKALFDRDGVRLAGVVVNKVLPEKYDKISRIVRIALEKKGLSVLGVLPYQKILDMPTMREIKEELKLELLYGAESLDICGEKILVGAMTVKDALQYLRNRSIVITPGDRYDILRALVNVHLDKKVPKKISGIILSGALLPDRRTQGLLQGSRIATLVSREDTYSIASKVSSLSVKVKPQDRDKIKIIIDMVDEYLDIDKVVTALT
jgi:BioD-like phosphotransacetylase family protein